MNKRHVFSTSSLVSARAVAKAAQSTGITPDHILIEARPDIEMRRIRDDRKTMGTDFLPAALRGAGLGSLAGMAGGLVALALPFFDLPGMDVVVLIMLGGLVGAWVAVLAGAGGPDEVRCTFAHEIAQGQVLVVVDAEPEQLAGVDQAAAQAGGRQLTYEANADME